MSPNPATTGVDVADTIVRIMLPLPLDVAATLTSAFGHLWPDSAIDVTGNHGTGMVMRIKHDDRCRTPEDARDIRAAKTYLESELASTVRGFDPDGSMRTDAPAYLAGILGAGARAVFEDSPGAVNYVEMQVRDPETGNAYNITLARSAAQRPSELHQAALERIAELEEQLDAARAALPPA